jgi:hypothetical protein
VTFCSLESNAELEMCLHSRKKNCNINPATVPSNDTIRNVKQTFSLKEYKYGHKKIAEINLTLI